jgi:anti-sigma factor RsiW
MSHQPPDEDDLVCVDLVRVISAYLDGEVDDAKRARIERHLQGCEGCQATVEQFQTVIRLAGRLSAADVARIDPLIRDRLMATLRIPRRR